jgi:hypothetical protein
MLRVVDVILRHYFLRCMRVTMIVLNQDGSFDYRHKWGKWRKFFMKPFVGVKKL